MTHLAVGDLQPLPTEMLLLPFTFLDDKSLAKARGVCKGFKELAEEVISATANQRVEAYFDSVTVLDLTVILKAPAFPATQFKFNDEGEKPINLGENSSILTCLITKYPGLTSVVLRNFTMSQDMFKLRDTDLIEFAQRATKLKRLVLGACEKISAAALNQTLITRKDSLEEVSIDTDNFDNEVVISCTSIENLTSLTLRGTASKINDAALQSIVISKKFGHLTKLQHFNITVYRTADRPFAFSTPRTLELVQSLKGLTYFGLASAPMTDEIVATIAANSPKLRGLRIGSCIDITPESLRQISKCSELCTLNLIDVSDVENLNAEEERLVKAGKFSKDLSTKYHV